MISAKKLAIAAAVTATLGASAGSAFAAQVVAYNPVSSTGGNFTMLSPGGSIVGGTNDVIFNWDGTVYNANSDYTGPGGASNATLASDQPFFGNKWTAHTVQIFAPGSYTFNTVEGAPLNMTVGAGQLGAHMLFNWGITTNIDVAIVWNTNTTFSGPMHTGADNGVTCNPIGCTPNGSPNNSLTTFMVASVDGNGDGINGIPMVDGPFPAHNANFNLHGTLTPVPVPAAVWLFGSGLLGLVGIARRKKKA